jgi:hypothetical protein
MTKRIKGKSSLSNWSTKYLMKIPMCEKLDTLRCPFQIDTLKQNDYTLAQFTQNLKHLVVEQDGAPWTGYYATYQGAKLAVLNYYGIWFKIQCHNNAWAAIHPV